jgi:lipoprotein-anchoring transpeptidase ErfK/SrfK
MKHADQWARSTNGKSHFIRVWRRNTGNLLTVAFLSLTAFNGHFGQASQRAEERSRPDLTSVTSLTQESATCNSQKVRAGRPPAPRETGYAHVEVNLSRQRLFVVDGSGCVVKTLPVSSGSEKWFTSEGRNRRAITPRGRFTVFRKIAGWHESPLGMLYYPNYIAQGVAIHGSPSVPSRPVSHGCIRIPMSAAKEFSHMTPIGTIVLVY